VLRLIACGLSNAEAVVLAYETGLVRPAGYSEE
jgi:hypothetical protein